jgi:signal transduction histidine kinase
MQRRILVVALIAVALAVTLLGAPLAIAVQRLLIADERGELVGEAVRHAVTVPRNLREGGGTLTLTDVNPDMHVAVYDGDGKPITGKGPDEPDSIVKAALEGDPADGFDGNDMVAAVPVLRGEDVVAVVRTSSPRAVLRHRELKAYAAMTGVAMFAIACAMLLALGLSRRLSIPIKNLRAAAEELGDGNFAVQAPTSGIRELDGVAASLNLTAQRLGQLVDRERSFSANASHQLRTPLTALRLDLDSAVHGDGRDLPTTAQDAMAIVDDLETTVEDLLAVARGRTGAAAALDLDGLLAALAHRWEGLLAAESRELTIRKDDPPLAAARVATARQVLDVLVDNAYRHGGGTVRVVARDASGALAIDVIDEGRPGTPSSEVDAELIRASFGNRERERVTQATELIARRSGHRARAGTRRGGTGIGLGLARSLLAADGGRLLLTSSPGRTCATVLLPAADPDAVASAVDQ